MVDWISRDKFDFNRNWIRLVVGVCLSTALVVCLGDDWCECSDGVIFTCARRVNLLKFESARYRGF